MKKPYSAPNLTRHGSLSRITQGSSGGNQDGKGGAKGGGGGSTGGGPPGKGSDRRLKKNVVPLVSLSRNFSLYLFDYIKPECEADQGRQLGVMADEVAKVMPEAVSSFDGYLRVDYDLLNIQPAEVVAAFSR